jgi:lantibiotic modifying enzyme
MYMSILRLIPLALLCSALMFGDLPRIAGANSYLDEARSAARWIHGSAVKTEHGVTWPADPADPKTAGNTLYSGSPGIILFFIEAFRATGNREYLNDARFGADELLLHIGEEQESGLYVGLGGIGFALIETYRVTRDLKYLDGARSCTALIKQRARKAGNGVEWSEVTDIIAGSAGIGLFLLYAARELHDPTLVALATQAGVRLIALARPDAGGSKWAMSPSFNRLMPNFSHGTAGISYFLAALYEATRSKQFLDAALSGASYLKSIAKTDGDVCLIFHNEPEGKDLFYLGWCHGPVGTARLFYKLYQVTEDREWMKWVERSARAIQTSGIPQKQTTGFWNNVSQCCGSAGVAEFFLDLYLLTKRQAYRSFAETVTANLLSRSSRDDKGLRWVQAEHRIKPDLRVAQTGYMQGAAGIGMLLLHLDEIERHARRSVVFPDSPFK